MEIKIMMGIPGCGKSYYVNTNIIQDGFQIVCRDDIRNSIRGEGNYKRQEPIVRAIALTMCRSFMERDLPIVIDETNTLSHQISVWLDLADEYLYTKIGIMVVSNIDICIERREGFPTDVIHKMSDQLTKLYIHEEETMKRFDSIKYVMGHDTDIDPKQVLNDLKKKYYLENF